MGSAPLGLFSFGSNDEEPLAVAPQQQSFARYRSISVSHKLCAQIQVLNPFGQAKKGLID
jgi:hypothetical protein